MFQVSNLKFKVLVLTALCALALPALAQWEEKKVAGIDLGQKLVLQPQVEALGGYDNRVIRSVGDGAEGDFFADLAAAAVLVNKPSRYDLWAKGRYGYRTYAQYSQLNDDFYTAAVSIGTAEGPLLWKLLTNYTKSLGYNTQYNPGSGQEPDLILSEGSISSLTRADVSYDSKRFSKTALIPRYTFESYNQKTEATSSFADWQIHNASLKLRHQYSGRTRFAIGGLYTLQANRDEDGSIATVGAGAEYRMTAKTSWLLQLGYALADYELSGTDQGFVSNLRGTWQVTPKVSTYVFGGNNFQPGYGGGGARMVYRLGYGARWQAAKKLSVTGGILHDYQEEIGSTTSSRPTYDEIRNFVSIGAAYTPITRLSLIASIRYNDDDIDPAQTILSLGATYRFY